MDELQPLTITILATADCPNAPVALQRVRTALGNDHADVDLVRVHDSAQAAERGMSGSPTILVGGIDPFASEGDVPSLSCRLYRDSRGGVAGAPTESRLREALAQARLEFAGRTGELQGCPGKDLDSRGRRGRGRQAPAEHGLRTVHQAVLRRFADTGVPPDVAELEAEASSWGRRADDVVAELSRDDFLVLDDAGAIRAAYPFSTEPTAHEVRIAGGARLWAMCAIDALGVSAMLGVDAFISSRDPVTGEQIAITTFATARDANSRTAVWDPAGAVVFFGQHACGGPAVDACCGALNFFAHEASARRWAAGNPAVTGQIISQTQAERIAESIFGRVLEP